MRATKKIKSMLDHSSPCQNEEGSSTLEFIFCAPLLLMVMFVAMEINERIEQRVTATIASGNSAWIADTHYMTNPGAAAEEVAKADILGTKSNTTVGIIGQGANPVFNDSSTVLSYSETKRRADSYVAKLDRFTGSVADQSVRGRAQAIIGDVVSDEPTRRIASVSVSAGEFMSRLGRPNVKWLPDLFPETHTEQQILSWSVSDKGTTNAALTAIRELSESVNGKDTSADLDRFSSRDFQVLAAKSMYLRRDPGFHPNGYVNQSIFGMGISYLSPGDSAAYKEFIKECFMKFEKSLCDQRNGFYPYVERIHAQIFAIKTMIDLIRNISCAVPLSPQCAAAITAKTMADQAIADAKRRVIDAIEKKVSDQVQKEIDGRIDQLGKEISRKFPQGLDGTINDEVKKLSDELARQIASAMTVKGA
jgi:hypothetical protein